MWMEDPEVGPGHLLESCWENVHVLSWTRSSQVIPGALAVFASASSHEKNASKESKPSSQDVTSA